MASRVGRRVCVHGRVQGVFFRQWTLGQARALGVSGWVRNCADGSVEAHVVGDEQSVATMIDRMRRGPSQARVDDITTQEIDADAPEGFSVLV